MVTTTLFVLRRGAAQEKDTGFLPTADLHLVVVPQNEHVITCVMNMCDCLIINYQII